MDLVLRAIVLFAFVFVLTRVIGRRELSSLQPFNLILLILLGDAIQQGLTQDDYSITGAVLVVTTIAVLQLAISFAGYRFRFLRPVLARGRQVGGARDERFDQLHSEVLIRANATTIARAVTAASRSRSSPSCGRLNPRG